MKNTDGALITYMSYQKNEIFKIFLGLMTAGFFFLTVNGVVFSADDTNRLIDRGEEALNRGDYEQAASVGMKILNEDPHNLSGYRFLMVYCVADGREIGFNRVVERAIKQGVPKLAIDKMAANILFLGGQSWIAYGKLCEYETEWSKAYERSR